MREKTKHSWSKTLVKKWFNTKSKAVDIHDYDVIYEGFDEKWMKNFPDLEACTFKRSRSVGFTEKSTRPNFDRTSKIDLNPFLITNVHDYRMFVATWNVGGKSPPTSLNLVEWLHASPPADIYVLGFQEIVPLNAGNVLGTEDNGPARKWQALIRKTLNNLPIVDDFEGMNSDKGSCFLQRSSFHSLSHCMKMAKNDIHVAHPNLDRRFSVCDRPSDYYWYDQNVRWDGSSDYEYEPLDSPGRSRYCLAASKQMVGIFLTVWIKRDLQDAVQNLKVSCVGRGLMGYLGNKGSISISMSLHQTSFCFICSHLTSGEKDGDELRRNSDVVEILRKTRFPRVDDMEDDKSPQTILDHDRIVWLGDLNYRIALSYRYAKALVEMRNWRALLENDQLRMEQREGRVFPGWNEGKIFFPPTYKYSNNSDKYAGEDMHPKEKRRTPAWCDRILWHGRGLKQLSYVRAETRFSDHRPVYSVFLAEVTHSRLKKSMSYSSSRVEVEELLPYSHGFGSLSC